VESLLSLDVGTAFIPFISSILVQTQLLNQN